MFRASPFSPTRATRSSSRTTASTVGECSGWDSAVANRTQSGTEPDAASADRQANIVRRTAASMARAALHDCDDDIFLISSLYGVEEAAQCPILLDRNQSLIHRQLP